MPGLFDLILGLGGRPDPRQQILANLGQAPGQVGSSTGPVPGAPPPAPPAGPTPGPAGAPPGPAAPAAAGPAAAPPQPQNLQSTPEMAAANAKLANPLDANAPAPAAEPVASGAAVPPRADAGPMPGSHIQLTPEMMLQMYNRDRAEQGFYRGLALMSAGAYPGRNPGANALMIPQSQDPASLMSNIMGLQKYQAEQDTRQALWDQIPKLAADKSLGLTEDQLKTMFVTDPAAISKIVELQAGIGATGTTKDLMTEQRRWMADNPGKTRTDMIAARPELENETVYAANKAGEIADTKQNTLDKTAASADFPQLDEQHSEVSTLIGKLQANRKGLIEAVQSIKPTTGPMGAVLSFVGAGLSAEGKAAANDLQLLHNKLYAEGWKGRGTRLSQAEAARLGSQWDNLTNPNQDQASIEDQLNTLDKAERRAHANAALAAGQSLSQEDYDLADSVYKPGGKLFNKGSASADAKPLGGRVSASTATAQPAQVASPADVAKLPSGTPFVVPSGPHKGEIRYAP